MLCENCQERPATLHFTKIINGEKNEYRLCEACAKEKGEMLSPKDSDFSFQDLLSGLLNFDQVVSGQSNTTTTDSLRCESCGLNFNQFKKTGKFGCADCYQYFEPRLEPIFRRIHGNIQHSGKVPLRSGKNIKLKKEVTQLKAKLQQKILTEEFEEAAKIRDEIKTLELKLSERRG